MEHFRHFLCLPYHGTLSSFIVLTVGTKHLYRYIKDRVSVFFIKFEYDVTVDSVLKYLLTLKLDTLIKCISKNNWRPGSDTAHS